MAHKRPQTNSLLNSGKLKANTNELRASLETPQTSFKAKPCIVCHFKSIRNTHRPAPHKIPKLMIRWSQVITKRLEYDIGAFSCSECGTTFVSIAGESTTEDDIYNRWRWTHGAFTECKRIYEYPTSSPDKHKWCYQKVEDVEESDEDEWPGYPDRKEYFKPWSDQLDAVFWREVPKEEPVGPVRKINYDALETEALKAEQRLFRQERLECDGGAKKKTEEELPETEKEREAGRLVKKAQSALHQSGVKFDNNTGKPVLSEYDPKRRAPSKRKEKLASTKEQNHLDLLDVIKEQEREQASKTKKSDPPTVPDGTALTNQKGKGKQSNKNKNKETVPKALKSRRAKRKRQQ